LADIIFTNCFLQTSKAVKGEVILKDEHAYCFNESMPILLTKKLYWN